MIALALLAAATDPVPEKPLASLLSERDKLAVVERIGVQGTVAFKISIDATGRVSECAITRSSGFAALDAETCTVVRKRTRFAPARDGQGRAVPGVLYGDINWDPKTEEDLRR